MRGTDKCDVSHHTIDQFRSELGRLRDVDWARLRALSAHWCRMNGLISETEDVVQEAIFRVFRGEATGERQWPCHVNFFAFMSGVMQSITSERRKLGFRAHIDRDMEDAPSVVSDAPEPESALNADAVEAYLLSLFDDDEEAQLMLMAWSEDTTKTEILAMTKWDAKKYEAVRKRIRRMLNKHPELREML